MSMSPQQEICTFFSVNIQYVEGQQKWTKACLMRESKIGMWICHFLAGSNAWLSFTKNSGKKDQKWVFLYYYVTPYEAPHEHSHSQREMSIYIYIYIYISSSCHAASMTLSHHFSLSFIASCRSSGLHPVSSHSCCMYVRAGRPAFAWPYVGVHRSTSLMSSSLLLQQCPACLVHLSWIVFMMGGRYAYSWCLVGFCHQDLFNIARNTLV